MTPAIWRLPHYDDEHSMDGVVEIRHPVWWRLDSLELDDEFDQYVMNELIDPLYSDEWEWYDVSDERLLV